MISVCILSYQRPGLLARTLASVLATADEPLELIVHDDGSNDPRVLGMLTDKLTRREISHLILNPPNWNEGVGTAFNRMAKIASGDIICKADQDLTYKPGWTQAVRSVLGASQAGFSEPDAAFPAVGALGLFKYHHPPVSHEAMHLHRREWDGVEWDEVADFCGSFIAIPRAAWRAFGPWEEHSAAFAEDVDFKGRIAANPAWCCALTTEDFIVNDSFGVGPSTVVEGLVAGEPRVHGIRSGPKLIER